jgi:hypothetical protein
VRWRLRFKLSFQDKISARRKALNGGRVEQFADTELPENDEDRRALMETTIVSAAIRIRLLVVIYSLRVHLTNRAI